MALNVKVEKLFRGFASVRDYVIAAAVKDRQDIIVLYKGKTMRIPLERLKSKWQLHARQFKSRYNDSTYALYDFRFEADDDKKQRIEDQPTLL